MRPEDQSLNASRLREDLVDTLTELVTDVVAGLPPTTRLRLIAFLHLLEEPQTTLAELDVDPSGLMRLTLTHTGAPAGTRAS